MEGDVDAPDVDLDATKSSIRRRSRCASGTPRVWMPTSATLDRSLFASTIS